MPPNDRLPTALPKAKSVAQQQREAYQLELHGKKRDGTEQLSLFDEFRKNLPADYLAEWEFFDAVPKFALSAQTSTKKGEGIGILTTPFLWGDVKLTSTISPVVLKSKGADGEPQRKEILPGPREETIFRVLKKMASDGEVTRVAGSDGNVFLRFTLNQLRMRLKEVDREIRIADIKEGLEVLGRSALQVDNPSSKKQLFSGTYINLKYVSEDADTLGERSLVEVGFNALAVAAINSELYDRIHYRRLMSLSPLGAWIYELLTRNFRQATHGNGYHISLSRIMAESGIQPHQRLRSNVLVVRKTMVELTDKDVLSHFPAVKEDVRYSSGGKAGRKSISEVIWTIFPSEAVIRDIRADNGDQARRRDRKLLRRN